MEVESVERHVTDGRRGRRRDKEGWRRRGEGEGGSTSSEFQCLPTSAFVRPSVRAEILLHATPSPCSNSHSARKRYLCMRLREPIIFVLLYAFSQPIIGVGCSMAFALLLSLSRRHRSGRSRDSQLNCGVKFYRKTSKISFSLSLSIGATEN